MWLNKYEQGDYYLAKKTIIDAENIYGLWQTKDEEHSIGIHLVGTKFFIYYVDGNLDVELRSKVPAFFGRFEKVLIRDQDVLIEKIRELENESE